MAVTHGHDDMDPTKTDSTDWDLNACHIPDISPPSRKAHPRTIETTEGGTGGTLGGGLGG